MRSLILCSLFFLTTMPGLRADEMPQAKNPLPPTVGTAPYHIASEDVLDIVVQDHPDLSKTTMVLPDGTISYPYAGEFKATGLTLREVSDRITSALSKEIADPQVMVTIKSLHERPVSQVTLMGGRASGKHILKEGWRVLDLLIESGGLPVDHPDSFSAKVIRNGTEIIPVDLPRIMSATDIKANFLLMPNDVLVLHDLDAPPAVTPAPIEILGEVNHPGMVAIPKDGSIIAMLAAVGGSTPKAALSKSVITHNGQKTTVDLSSVLTEGKLPAGVILQPGDTLLIPQNILLYTVYGAVAHPGPQTYPDVGSITALTALTAAGGPTANAKLQGSTVTHPSQDSAKASKSDVTKVNLDAVMKKGDSSQDVAIHPGDILFVPAYKGGPNLLSVLSAASLLRVLVP